jgi:hypothetical protein
LDKKLPSIYVARCFPSDCWGETSYLPTRAYRTCSYNLKPETIEPAISLDSQINGISKISINISGLIQLEMSSGVAHFIAGTILAMLLAGAQTWYSTRQTRVFLGMS